MPERTKYQELSKGSYGIYQADTEPPAISPQYASIAHNMVVNKGMLHTRPGIVQVNGVQCGSSGKRVVYGIDLFKTSTEDRLIVACGDVLQYLPITGGDPVTLTNSFPSSGFVTTRTGAATSFAHINGMMYIVNGVDENVKYNGTNLTRVGIVAPTTLSAPSLSAGTITGTRLYKATLVGNATNGSVESEPTSATSVTYAAQQGTFSAPSITGSDPQVDRWNLYGTVTGGTAYFRINTTPATTATTIIDNLSDADVSASTPLADSGQHSVPPGKFQVLAVHQGRLVGFLASSNVLYWSDLGLDVAGLYPKPENWPTANLLEFPETGGNKLTAIVSFYEWLVVFQEFGIWSIKHTLADDEERVIAPVLVAPDYRGLGVANQGSVAVLDNRIVFAGKDGAYAIRRDLNTSQPDLSVELLSDHIASLYQQFDFAQGAVSCADRDNRRFIFVGTGKVET